MHAWVKLLANATQYASYLPTKHHVSGRIAHLFVIKKYLQVSNPAFPRIKSDIHGKSAAFN